MEVRNAGNWSTVVTKYPVKGFLFLLFLLSTTQSFSKLNKEKFVHGLFSSLPQRTKATYKMNIVFQVVCSVIV